MNGSLPPLRPLPPFHPLPDDPGVDDEGAIVFRDETLEERRARQRWTAFGYIGAILICLFVLAVIIVGTALINQRHRPEPAAALPAKDASRLTSAPKGREEGGS